MKGAVTVVGILAVLIGGNAAAALAFLLLGTGLKALPGLEHEPVAWLAVGIAAVAVGIAVPCAAVSAAARGTGKHPPGERA